MHVHSRLTLCLGFLSCAFACFHAGPIVDDGTDSESATGGELGGESEGEAEATDAGETGSCGNGVTDPGEECDLGQYNDDAEECKSDCTLQACGDGDRGKTEGCDDGNLVDGDGCSADCVLESCQNGQLDPGEQCDDGNASNTDACLDNCLDAFCGDGYTQIGVESCDDMNYDNTDACTTACALAACGDGYEYAGVEACDDGNTVDTDACTSDCNEAVCGDLIVREGVEECDDGNQNDADGCTDGCIAAYCGDGFVWQGMEECDDHNFSSTDACTNDCTAAECGDGYVQVGVEACDDGNLVDADACVDCENNPCGNGQFDPNSEGCDDGNHVAGDGCSSTCQDEFKLVFVTSTAYTGNLGGVAGADQKCQQHAAGLQGTFLAWISDAQTSPTQRFTKPMIPYRRVDGTVIASNWNDLVDGQLAESIQIDEAGEQLYNYVWTGTVHTGNRAPDRCNEWLGGEFGVAGFSQSVSNSWSITFAGDCNAYNSIYCFEQ